MGISIAPTVMTLTGWRVKSLRLSFPFCFEAAVCVRGGGGGDLICRTAVP